MFLNAPTYMPHEPPRRLPWLRFLGIATTLLLILGAFLAVAVPHPIPASSTPQQEHRVYNYPSYTPEDWGRSFSRAERQNGDASPPLSPVGKRESLLSLAWGSTSNFRSGIGSYLDSRLWRSHTFDRLDRFFAAVYNTPGFPQFIAEKLSSNIGIGLTVLGIASQVR